MTSPSDSPAIPELDAAMLSERLGRGEARLVDVREADEHARERIPGSTLRPLSRFAAAELVADARSGITVVLHCRSGRRSADAVRTLIAAGAPPDRVRSLTGGIEAWKSKGLPVELDTRVSRISVMRQVQLTVGTLVLAGALAAWLVHPAFLIVPAFFGAGLMFAGASGTCGMALALERMPWNRAARASSATGSNRASASTSAAASAG
ncbi:MAG: rhodanese-like domain-containing protein [Phycisphaerae bacterium]|nr:rhodanese-like domain-containing protein [Phycisphaerae bacterium]